MTEITKAVEQGNALDLWRKKDKIRQMFAPTLGRDEFEAFVGLGASLGANPFNREIWAVKYGNSAAQIFLGRDFYRRKAQEQADYNGHQVDAIYSNDEFVMEGGKPKHSYKLSDRGELIGAYCVVYRSDNEPYFVTVEFSEYFAGGNNNPNLWDNKPSTMIKKVAEAQALRGAFQGVFAGTYDHSEEWQEPESEYPQLNEALPADAEPLRGRYPFDKTLKAPKNDHRPYLNDGSDELDKVEEDIREGILNPRYIRYFYTVTNDMYEYITSIPEQMIQLDRAVEEQR
jgi:phage recombination protein Bet